MTEVKEESAESVVAPEISRDEWKTLEIIQRHSGPYESGKPADPPNITDQEKATLGRLTTDGIDDARKKAREKIDVILFQDPETDFLILASPTSWLDNPELGQRALETAELIAEVVRETSGQLLNDSVRFKGGLARPYQKLAQSNFPDEFISC